MDTLYEISLILLTCFSKLRYLYHIVGVHLVIV